MQYLIQEPKDINVNQICKPFPTGSQATSSRFGIIPPRVLQTRTPSPGASSTALKCRYVTFLHWSIIIRSRLFWVLFLKVCLIQSAFDSWQPLNWCLQKSIHINSYASFLSGTRELNPLLTMFILRGMVLFLYALPYNYWHWISCAISLISQLCKSAQLT